MDVRHLFRLSVLFVSGQMLYRAVTQQCGSEASIFGWKLRRHIYHTMMAELGDVCVLACQKDDRCQSFNFVISVGMCEFSDRTKEARPEDFIPDPDRYYFRRAMNRVALGSIPELPAETCKEIKASEGQAVSGKYWLSNIKPGMAELAYCDMNTEDVDECRASPPVCDVNAKCKNTRGSYRCTCNTGFTGDGKICQDINECSASSAPCDVNANCQNTEGSYLCSCKPGFTGDGETCKDINECSGSPSVCDVNANCQNNKGSYVCSCKVGFTGDGKVCKDVDECSTNAHRCDVNAVCNNINGSYNCSCNAGYSGDGKTCTDIDECASGVHICHKFASCTNTVGSYSCSCTAHYTGDGRTCTRPYDECQNYVTLNSADRKITYPHDLGYCDRSIGPGWFRFDGAAGKRMPSSCTPMFRCGTSAPGWLRGGHPSVGDGQVTRTVCFHYWGNCCQGSSDIQVRNCGHYYVYYLGGNNLPNCDLRYCGSD